MTTRPTLSFAARGGIDFAMGVGLFALVAGCVSLGHGIAFASGAHGQSDPAAWLTTVSIASPQSGIGWHPLTRDAALMLLAMGSGIVTAFNMALARHLRTVAAQTAPVSMHRTVALADAHTNY